MNPIYCKYSSDRAAEFQIKTAIFIDDEGQKIVRKFALSDASLGHVDNIYKHYLQMEKSFADSVLTPNKCKKIENGVELEFVKGETLEQYLDKLYIAGKYLDVIEEIKQYRDILYSLSDNVPFHYTKEFDTVFGKNTRLTDCQSLSVSNIDLIFGNIILGEKWTILDYEWSFDFPVPIDFIIYRAIHYYLYSSTKRKALLNFHVFELLGISERDVHMYSEMECNFQQYVAGNRYTLAELKRTMLKHITNAVECLPNRRTNILQVFIDDGSGFKEEHSIKTNYYYCDGEVTFHVNLREKVTALRVDPAASAVIIKDFHVWGNGEELRPTATNGILLENGTYFFGTEDPQIIINDISGINEIYIHYVVVEVTDFWKADAAIVAKRCQQLEEENIRLLAAKTQAEEYIQNLHNKLSWRLLAKIKSVLKRR